MCPVFPENAGGTFSIQESVFIQNSITFIQLADLTVQIKQSKQNNFSVKKFEQTSDFRENLAIIYRKPAQLNFGYIK